MVSGKEPFILTLRGSVVIQQFNFLHLCVVTRVLRATLYEIKVYLGTIVACHVLNGMLLTLLCLNVMWTVSIVHLIYEQLVTGKVTENFHRRTHSLENFHTCFPSRFPLLGKFHRCFCWCRLWFIIGVIIWHFKKIFFRIMLLIVYLVFWSLQRIGLICFDFCGDSCWFLCSRGFCVWGI